MNSAIVYNVLLSAADGGGETQSPGLFGNMTFIIVMVLMFAAMYFIMIRPNRKREKEATEMRNTLEIGDEVTTIGGIVGRVVSIKDDTIVLETAGERSRIRFLRGAIDKVNKLNMEEDSSKKETTKVAATTEKKAQKAKSEK
jgi:preprotein translocase subunit YajC